MSFLLLKYLHIFSVAASFALLFIRGIWLMRAYPPAQEAWVRGLPHAVDGVLLVSALAMAWVHPPVLNGTWLLAKLVLLGVYVGLVVMMTKVARSAAYRLALWFAALVLFLQITSIAVLHHPLGIFSLM